MNEQTDMHNPDADKKTIGKGRKKNLICIFFGYSSANPDRCFIL